MKSAVHLPFDGTVVTAAVPAVVATVVDVVVEKGPVCVNAKVVKITAAEIPRKTTVPIPTPIKTFAVVDLIRNNKMLSKISSKEQHLQ